MTPDAVIKCPEGHTRVWKKGSSPTRKGPKVRYICYTCGRSFYHERKPVCVPRAPVKVKASKPRKSKAKSG